MTTSREHTVEQSGPVLFEATTVAAHLTIIVEDRPAALVTVSTPAASGPTADAVRYATFEGGPGFVSVLLWEPTAGLGSTVINRGGVTIIQTGSTVVGTVIGSLNVIDGGMVIGAVRGVGVPISIEARLPLGSSLACETTSGNVGTRGDLVDVDAVTVSGDIRIDTVRLPHLRTTSGGIRIAQLNGIQATARTVSGDIDIHTVTPAATVQVRSVSGDIRVTGPDIDLNAQTVSGRVTTR